ncbi:MAG: HAMP domain-containing sensor histidine kinase [Elusimicrobiota bacterium]|nr:HAMP domain-containing sensor histidine kinase [Elusimicrobiota bacterium]
MNELKQISEDKEIKERLNRFISQRWIEKLNWFITVRWIAVMGLFVVITAAKYLLDIKLPVSYLYSGNVLLLFYNILFFFYFQRLKSQKNDDEWSKRANRFANLQISSDLILLAYLIHFSGGIENPFIFYFIFHMVISSILLSNKDAYLQATLSIFILGLMVAGEWTGVLPHYHLDEFFFGKIQFFPKGMCILTPQYMSGLFFVFISTLYLTVYMATQIVNRLRREEKELVIVNKKLEEQDKLKSQYVHTVSHDLQASLSAIQSCLKVVLSDLTGTISQKTREMVARAEQRSRAVLHFVKDLLDLSKMRADKKLDKKPIPLSEIVTKVIEQLKPRMEEKKLSFVGANLFAQKGGQAHPCVISANPDAMEQLFTNLLVNAIRYTPWGGKITVGCQPSTVNGFIQVSIEDTGIGIPQEDLPHIFEDFYRAKNAEQTEKDGTGLGLSIVKQIVNAHGGEIRVESQVGKGSKFFITLPEGQ